MSAFGGFSWGGKPPASAPQSPNRTAQSPVQWGGQPSWVSANQRIQEDQARRGAEFRQEQANYFKPGGMKEQLDKQAAEARQQNAWWDQEQERQRQAEAQKAQQRRSQYARPQNMSDAAFDYLTSQEAYGGNRWAAPTFQVWSELTKRPKLKNDAAAYGDQLSPGYNAAMANEMNTYRQDTRYAQGAGPAAPGWGQANPFQQQSWTPWKGVLQKLTG